MGLSVVGGQPKVCSHDNDVAQILNQWGPLDADLAGKQRYAAWRAAEVSKVGNSFSWGLQ